MNEETTMSEHETLDGALFANDCVLPGQWGSKRGDPYANERLLWANVLADAINCVRKCPPEFITGVRNSGGYESVGGTNRRRRDGMQAQAWIESNDTGPCSFLWLCDALDCDPDYLRKRIAEGVTLRRRSPASARHGVTLARPRRRKLPDMVRSNA